VRAKSRRQEREEADAEDFRERVRAQLESIETDGFEDRIPEIEDEIQLELEGF